MKKIYILILSLITFNVAGFAQRILPSAYNKSGSNSMSVNVSNSGDFLSNPLSSAITSPDSFGKSLIYTSALWIGGVDESGSLHLAAMTYRQKGFDYFPGPVSRDSVVSSNTYNQVYKINQNDIQNQIANPGSVTAINNYPGNGSTAVGEPAVIAPFMDLNKNEIYEPALGEYPLIRGQESTFSIFNDNGFHSETGSKIIKAEVKNMVTTFANGGVLDSTVLVHFSITNKSKDVYNNFYFSLATDFEIGYYADDYIGCDATRNLYFGYNADNDDNLPTGYGTNAPAVGVLFLNKQMQAFKSYENSMNPMNGNPRYGNDFYNYMSGLYADSSEVKDLNGNVSKMELNGDVASSTEWNAFNSGKMPGDYKGVGSHGPFTFWPDQTICFDVAYLYGRGKDNLDAVKTIQKMADSLQLMYDQGKLTNNFSFCKNQFGGVKQSTALTNFIRVYPNPTNASIQLNGIENLGEISLIIVDQLGKIILHEDAFNSASEISVSQLTSGVYTIIVDSKEGRFTTRFVKQ